MIKTTSIPAELRTLTKPLQTVTNRHNPYDAFGHFLDLFIRGFSFNYDKNIVHIRSSYNQTERFAFGEMIQQTLLILSNEIRRDTDTYDVFGTLYESLSISNKYFGQFFTPLPICQLCAEVVLRDNNKEHFLEPCSGSGRMALAANSVNPGMFHALIDKDFTCVQMSALNLLLHGIKGIVISDNALAPGSSFQGAFIVNRLLSYTGIPQIEYIKDINYAYGYTRNNTGDGQTSSGMDQTTNSCKNQEDLTDIKELFADPTTGQYKLF